ncbi:MAG: hypothetical protein JWN86_998 [Planctomycetota bacterium]|nr:hypothetical protein [Planctomycetota bacterium]
MARRVLPSIVLLAAILHGVGIARSSLPAQDGLKFLRVARQFHAENWMSVVRGSDQHPLYPALIAVAQPCVALGMGPSPDSWRLSAQVVSALASIALLIPLFLLARALFGGTTAAMTALLYVLLPLPAEIGHDTLSDPLALLGFTTALWLGHRTLRTRGVGSAIGCGFAAGLGYLARPEVAIVPLAVVVTAFTQFAIWTGSAARSVHAPRVRIAIPALSIAFLTMVGSYAIVKGEVSEKLALRRGVAIPSPHDAASRNERRLPPGLDDARWDFSAKEESGHPTRLSFPQAVTKLGARWSEAMGLLLVPLTIWGVWRSRSIAGWRLLGVYSVLFVVVLVRHAITFGYLSSRHTLSLVIVALPFASAGILACVRTVRDWREYRSPGSVTRTNCVRIAALIAMIAIAISVQFHHSLHPSRWGHGEAGRWLSAHAGTAEKVLDTRGWATFVSGRTGHDYWHVKQALSDPALSYVVVGEDERNAASPRAETLRAILAYAAEPIASFPEREGGTNVGVRVYRFQPPADWKGMRP